MALGLGLPPGSFPNSGGWKTFAEAGVTEGQVVRYLILDGNGAWEYGLGTYSELSIVPGAWNPVDITPTTTLSNGNLTVTAASGTSRGVRGTKGLFTGKNYWEGTVVVQTSIADLIGIGTFSAPLGVAGGACAVIRGGQVSINGSFGVSFGPLVNGDVIQIASDLDARLIWFRIPRISPNWNANASANPTTNVGGLSISSLVGALFPFAGMANAGDSWTANFGATPFANPVPAGFTPGWPDATTAPLAWDPETITAVTLSGGNLVATGSGSAVDQGCRVPRVLGKTAGKCYFEVTPATANNPGNNAGFGLGTTASTYSAMGGSATSGNMIYRSSGNIWASGGNTGVTLGAIAANTTIGVAVDLDNRKIWFRKAPAGNWNNNATNNPATNVGGITIPAGTMIPFCIFGGVGGVAGSTVTANFGGSAFSGAVPAGFAAGWVDNPFPDAGNTGVPAGTTLTPSGPVTSSANNQIIDALDITGTVVINHNNVTIKRCRITSGDFFVVSAGANGHHLIVEDCEIDGNGTASACYLPEATLGSSIIRRCNLHNAENGIFIGENNMTIRDNYIHDLESDEVDPHYDGIQGSGGFTALMIEHNSIYGRDTSCIILQNEGGAFSGAVVNNNLLVMNAGSAPFYCRSDKGVGAVSNITVTNNLMGKGVLYNSIVGVTNLTYTGNVDYLTGAPIGSGD